MSERHVDEAEEIEQSLLEDFTYDDAGNDECRSIIESWLVRVRKSGGANRSYALPAPSKPHARTVAHPWGAFGAVCERGQQPLASSC